MAPSPPVAVVTGHLLTGAGSRQVAPPAFKKRQAGRLDVFSVCFKSLSYRRLGEVTCGLGNRRSVLLSYGRPAPVSYPSPRDPKGTVSGVAIGAGATPCAYIAAQQAAEGDPPGRV